LLLKARTWSNRDVKKSPFYAAQEPRKGRGVSGEVPCLCDKTTSPLNDKKIYTTRKRGRPVVRRGE